MEEYLIEHLTKEVEYRVNGLKYGQAHDEKIYTAMVAEIRLLEDIIAVVRKMVNEEADSE